MNDGSEIKLLRGCDLTKWKKKFEYITEGWTKSDWIKTRTMIGVQLVAKLEINMFVLVGSSWNISLWWLGYPVWKEATPLCNLFCLFCLSNKFKSEPFSVVFLLLIPENLNRALFHGHTYHLDNSFGHFFPFASVYFHNGPISRMYNWEICYKCLFLLSFAILFGRMLCSFFGLGLNFYKHSIWSSGLRVWISLFVLSIEAIIASFFSVRVLGILTSFNLIVRF